MARYPGFVFGSDPSQSPLADPQRTINWYPEPIQAPGVPSSAVLYPTPGWRTYADTGYIGCRALYAIDGQCYAVVGAGLFGLAEDHSVTQLNSSQLMAVDDNPAQMTWDGHTDHKLAVCSGGNLYLYDTNPTAAPWTTTPFSNPVLFTSGEVTISIASPAVITQTAHGFVAGDVVMFNTTGALPTGLSVGTLYYVIAAGLTANTFEVSTTAGGSAVNTSGTQSGTHTVLHGNVPAFHVNMIAARVLAFDNNSKTLYWSDTDDATTWNPLSYTQRSIAPDPWQAMTVDGKNLIWLIGEQTGEVWYYSGALDAPFAPVPGAVFRYGIAAPWSLTSMGDQVVWLSQNVSGNGIVVMTNGYTPERISTYAVETAINKYAATVGIADAEGYVYQDQGHVFYVLTFPAANATWVFDMTTGLWHERGTWNSSTFAYEAWPPRWHAFAFGTHLVGDRDTGIVSEMSVSLATEGDGTHIRRLRIPPPLACADRMQRMIVSRFELLLEPGTGNGDAIIKWDMQPQSYYGDAVYGTGRFGITTDGSATVRMRSSVNAKTWGNLREASNGSLGEYDKRVTWYGCGSSLNLWIPEITVSDAIPWRILNADVKGSNIQGVTDGAS